MKALKQGKKFWNQVKNFDKTFNVFDTQKNNQIFDYLTKQNKNSIVADLGTGTGKLLPFLSGNFRKIIAVDFAPNLLNKARRRCKDFSNIEYLELDLRNLKKLYNKVDIAVSVNSILPDSVREADKIISEIYKTIKRGGKFVGILPSIDTVIYRALLEYDKLLNAGLTEKKAYQKIKDFLKTHGFDILGFYKDQPGTIKRKYFYPFEIQFRFSKAGFKNIQITKIVYPWKYCKAHHYGYFPKYEQIWDWFVTARK